MEAAGRCDLAMQAACGGYASSSRSLCEVCTGKRQHLLRSAGCSAEDVEGFCSDGTPAVLEAFISLTSATCTFRTERGRDCTGNILPKRFFWQMCTQLSWAGQLYDNATGEHCLSRVARNGSPSSKRFRFLAKLAETEFCC